MAEGRLPYHSGDVALYESLRQPVLARLREELQGSPDTCTVCAQLCECAAEFDPEVRIRYRFGLNLDEILALDCAAHRPFFEKLREAMNEKARRFYRGASEDVRRRAEAQAPTQPLGVELRGCILYVGWGNLGRRVPLEMARRDDVPGHPGSWARMQSPRVDLDLIKSWRRRCATVHGDECANPWKVAPVKPLWLIDAEQRCLVPGEEAGAYVCLSYRRGRTQGFRTTQASLPDLQNPGCLDRPEIAERLPRVVTDALQLVRDLDERYLWVDALCIAHDDAAAEAAEMARMGRLYGSAALTLVAADDGDDDEDVGLPGVTEAAPGRLASQMLLPLGGERLLAFPPTPGLDPTPGTAYADRAWTLQEYELAGRRLVFAGNRVHWVCPRQCCDEWQRPRRLCWDAQCPRHNPPSRARAPSLTVHGLPDLWAYRNLTQDYNGRRLTHDADAPRALSGLLAVLGRGFPGGFLWALPVMFLDAALGWRPAPGGATGAGNMTRRAIAEPRAGDPVAHLPSWSWLGWQGPAQCCLDEDGLMADASDTAFQTQPITTWYSAARPSFDQRDGPLPSWFRSRPAHCDPDGPLPPGWTRRHLDTPSERPSHGFDRPPAGCGRYVFAHESLPYRYFWYHFALPAGTDEATTAPQPAYLGATAPRLRLEAYRDPALAPGPGRYRPTVGLRDPGGERVGHLWLHSMDDLEQFPAEASEGAPVELVAVCRRESAQKPKAYEADEFYREHYAVLWVEWEDGVANRRASGVVDRAAWDAHPGREEIDLILG